MKENNTISNSILFHKKRVGRRSEECPILGDGTGSVSYQNIALLKKYISEKGRILPRRLTGLSAKAQRKVSEAIKRARHLALLPYTVL